MILQVLGVQPVQSKLLAFPVKLVDDKGVADGHASSISNPHELLVDILMHDVDQLLMQEVVLVSVLEQKSQQWALRVELEVKLVNQGLEHLFEVLGQQLLQLGLGLVVVFVLVIIIGQDL